MDLICCLPINAGRSCTAAVSKKRFTKDEARRTSTSPGLPDLRAATTDYSDVAIRPIRTDNVCIGGIIRYCEDGATYGDDGKLMGYVVRFYEDGPAYAWTMTRYARSLIGRRGTPNYCTP